MNKGRIITKTILARLLFSAAALVLCAPITYAQQGDPEIYIDMGVLQDVGSAPAATPAPVKLRPPTPRPANEQGMASHLTAPAPAPVPIPAPQQIIVQPAPKPIAARPNTPPAIFKSIKPDSVSKPPDLPPGRAPLTSPPPPAAPAPIPSPPVPAPVSKPVATPPPAAVPAPTIFPVETRVRTETNDPAYTKTSRPVPVRPENINDKQEAIAPAFPAPEMAPAIALAVPPLVPAHKPSIQNREISVTQSAAGIKTQPAQAADIKVATPPFVPGRRPDFVEKAPAELVAELRAREAARTIDKTDNSQNDRNGEKRKIDLNDPPPPPGPRGQRNMPAVKKAAVDAEPVAEQTIKLSAQNDPLLDKLVEKDKESLVATIESLVEAREDGKALPAPAKSKRETGSNIVKAEPMQRPYNVYRPQKKDDSATALASLPPIQGIAPVSRAARPPQPQAQDEQAYVSIPFSEGLTEVSNPISGEIEKRILPLLNQNPTWTLQIQAFASPVKDGASSARKASLARALSVRSYLLSKGIEATRMDVRALGAESDRDPMDRVDLLVFDPAKKI